MTLAAISICSRRREGELGIAELERHERVYRRYRENYAEQTEWHERRFAAA